MNRHIPIMPMFSLLVFSLFLHVGTVFAHPPSYEAKPGRMSAPNKQTLGILRQHSEGLPNSFGITMYLIPNLYAGLSLIPLIGNLVYNGNKSLSARLAKKWGLAGLIVGGFGLMLGAVYTVYTFAQAGAMGGYAPVVWLMSSASTLLVSLLNVILGWGNYVRKFKGKVAYSPYFISDSKGDLAPGLAISFRL